MRKEPIAMMKECAIDHLSIHGNLTAEEQEVLESKEPYELFMMMYQSMRGIIDDIQRAKLLKDLEAYKIADEQLWKHGHALMGFAVAEILGWMRNLELVDKQEELKIILVPYSIRFAGGLVMSKEAVLDLNTGELLRWDEIPVKAVGDEPESEFIELFTDNPNVLIEKEVVTIDGRKMLRLTITEEDRKNIHLKGHEEMRILLKRDL